MTPGSRAVFCAFVTTGALIGSFALSQTPEPEGRVTAIFHDVQLLPEQADARPAAINDKVDDGTALRTGNDSRSELTFADLTITRLGANTIFSFNKAGRTVRLDSGAILLYARKNSGPAQITTKAVSVGITGTTVIFEAKPDSYDQLIVLEGAARFSLNSFPDQATEVRAGEVLHVQSGARKLPKPGRVDLRRIMNTHPLIKNFPPLPSLDLILAGADGRNLNGPPAPIVGAGSQGGPSPVYLPTTGPSPGPPPWWCCIDGRVVQIPETQARVRGNQCYRSREEALAHCPATRTCWCCINAADTKMNARAYAGQVVEVTEADCRARGGQCYASRKEALKNCRGAGPTPTPTLTPYRPYPTPRPTPAPTPYSPGGHVGRPTPTPYQPGGHVGGLNNRPTPTPTPRKRWPRIKHPTPTPTPKRTKFYSVP